METKGVILDTSAYSHLLRGNRAINDMLASASEVILTPIIIGELLAGFKNGAQEKKNRSLLRQFLTSPGVRVISLDEDTSERYAAILDYLFCQGTPIPTNDLWIAASAMQHGFKVITTDHHYLKIPHILTQFCEP